MRIAAMTSDPAERHPQADDPLPDDQDWDEISFEELGEAYAKAMAQSDEQLLSEQAESGSEQTESEPATTATAADVAGTGFDDEHDDELDAVPTPQAIIEAALFIGDPSGRPLSEAELAALMRGVSVEDVSRYVDRLNQGYQANQQAFRIHRDEDGLRLGVAPDMEIVRRAFYGKIRETRLSQAAIEVLSLVAYQPGITAEKVQDQRGKESGSLLSQLVRRRLLEMRRVVAPGATRPVATYHPTERFLQLFGLDSLDDLPQVED
jgi:segregation and condensation protein B